MQVMCIKQGSWRSKRGRGEIAKGPIYGDICVVESVKKSGFFYLKEYPADKHGAYDPIHFIPLSSIDETDMERNYKTEKV